MRKLITIMAFVLIALCLISCDTFAQGMYYDGFTYEYTYTGYPVRYVNGIPYYYGLYNNAWTWIMIDRMYYGRIVHHPRPMVYHYRRSYPHHNGYRVTPHTPNHRPDYYHRPPQGHIQPRHSIQPPHVNRSFGHSSTRGWR